MTETKTPGNQAPLKAAFTDLSAIQMWAVFPWVLVLGSSAISETWIGYAMLLCIVQSSSYFVLKARLVKKYNLKFAPIGILWPILWIPLIMSLVGPSVALLRLASKVNSYFKELATYRQERAEFLDEYPKRLEELTNAQKQVVPWHVRVSEYLELNPGAVLDRAPQNAIEFELIARNWMQLWGVADAKVTQFSNDGGLDVVSSEFGAQVKFYANAPVGRPEIQNLFGAASGAGLSPAFFAYSSGYTAGALQWAASVGVACFTFVPRKDGSFWFEANTEEAANLALREEGLSYQTWAEISELNSRYELYQDETPVKYRVQV